MNMRIHTLKMITDEQHIGRWLIGILVLLMIMFSAPVGAAPSTAPSGTCGSSSTIICIDPATQTIGRNQVTTADIRIDNVTDLYGADVILSYNKFILCAQDATDPCPNQTSVQLTPGPLLTSQGKSKYSILFN